MAAAPTVNVYGPAMSTAVSRVLACLIEKDVQFQLIPVNMAKGEHKKPHFLKIQVIKLPNSSSFTFLSSLTHPLPSIPFSPLAKFRHFRTTKFPSLSLEQYVVTCVRNTGRKGTGICTEGTHWRRRR